MIAPAAARARPLVAVVGETADANVPAKARLLASARTLGADVVFHGSDLRGPAGARPIEAADVVLVRGGSQLPAATLDGIRNLQRAGMPVVNEPDSVAAAANKLRTAVLLEQAGVAHPRTIPLAGPEDVAAAVDALGTPLVLKVPQGSQGKGITIHHSQRAAQEHADTVFGIYDRLAARNALPHVDDLDPRMLAQEFLAEAGASDLRALVVREPSGSPRLVAAMQRTAADGSMRSNLHSGGSARPAVLSDAQRGQALAATDALGLDVAGVDLIRSHQSPTGMMVVEVNSSPGGAIQQVTGAPVSDRIMETVLARARSRS